MKKKNDERFMALEYHMKAGGSGTYKHLAVWSLDVKKGWEPLF